MKLPALVLAAALVGVPAQARAQSDSRWAPWLGCWELIGENVRDAGDAAGVARPRANAAPRDRETTPRVCATPAGDGVTFTTTIAGETALAQTVIANGAARPVDDADCRGTQRAEWSQDGSRVYSSAELTCANDRMPRRVSGMSLLGRNGAWIDIQAVEIGGREDVRVRRYRRAAQAPAASAVPAIVATRLTIEDVKEASAKVSPRAVEAALIETGAAFELDGRTLLELDAAGVAGSVVDVMVALSYPDRFVVERSRDDRSGRTVFLSDPFSIDYGFYSPLYGSLYYPYYYSPFAYSYYGRFDPRFFGGGVVVVPVIPDGGDGTTDPPASGAARAVDGLGYTRVRPRNEEPTVQSGRRIAPGRDAAATSTGSSGAASAPASSGSSGSSGGGAVSSGGFSSGGGSDSGRTAVPR